MLKEEDFLRLKNHIGRFMPAIEEEWANLKPILYERKLVKDDFYARKGRHANEVAFILEGSMRQFYTHQDEEKTTYFFFEDHLVSAYMSCISAKPSELSIIAMTDCRLLAFTYSDLKKLYAARPVWEGFGRRIAEYLAMGLEERMVDLLMLTPEERYLRLLNSNKHKIIERIPQQYIANYLGITPVSLSRIRKRIFK